MKEQLSREQKEQIDVFIRHLQYLKQTNDINSPSILSDFYEECETWRIQSIFYDLVSTLRNKR